MMANAERHCTDLLAEHAAGVLTGPERTEVEAHLTACPSCRAALASWTAVAGAAAPPAAANPAANPAATPAATSAVRAALARAALDPQPPAVRRRRLSFVAQLLRAELRLVRPSLWLASLLVMGCAVGLAVAGGNGAGATVLSLVAPLVAVAGVAGVYGPERDPAFDALAVTVTSPRLVLLARVTLVFAYDLALAMAASGVVRLAAPQVGLVDLVAGWLGPMTLLSALSLLLATSISPTAPMSVAGTLWLLRALTIGAPPLADGWLAAAMREVWATNRATVAATLVLLAVVVVLSRRHLRPRGRWPRLTLG
jgi:Putative zinc-finger